MNTDDLIARLAAEGAVRRAPPGRALGLAVAAGALVALAVLFGALGGPRPDFAASLSSPRFLAKFAVTLALAGAALPLLAALARPGADPVRRRMALALPVLVVAVAVAGELLSIDAGAILPNLVGSNARHCVVFVPLLGLGPLVALTAALAYGAPTRPRLAGAVAGLVAGGIGATAYAAYCPDDSPLFVATWYPVGVAVLTAAGAAAAGRFARW